MNKESMKQYARINAVKACPCSLMDSVSILLEATQGKNYSGNGYIVEYHNGYRLWVPVEVFEEEYRPSETFLDRLRIEHEDLKNRYMKGQEFMYSTKFNQLEKDDKLDLNVQMDLMRKYPTSVANALVILVDYIELNFRGGFTVTDIKEMEYCVVIIDHLKSAGSRKYELDIAYLKGEMSMENFVEDTCDNISKNNPDMEEDGSQKEEVKKFYQIVAHVVMHNDEEGDVEQDHTFIVQAASAVRANMLIEKWLRDRQEERYRESLKHPERTFVKYQIDSFIEESKTIPIGYFIPMAFSEVYNED